MTQAEALSIMKTGVNIYLTGSAGSGKTYLLNQYIQYLRDHDISVAVTASTGIAATHMGGITIHGFSGIGIRESLTEYDIDALLQKPYLAKRFEHTQVLIIDEVSMLHAKTLDMTDQVCRAFKRVDKPFGGLQVILSGDFFQLPPISRSVQIDGDARNFVIYSEAWKNMKPAVCYLSEQHRQDDQDFMDILNAIRDADLSDLHIENITKRIGAELKGDLIPTKLYTHNADVDTINQRELDILNGQEKAYEMIGTGRDVIVEGLKKSCLAPTTLRLKEGAEVMFVKNNFEKGYVNGTRGKVQSFLGDSTPVVKLHSGKTIQVPFETWAIEEEGKVKASIIQYPLRLAWAITIHKSQGMSLDNAEIDLSKTFAYGMGYVALSRVRTLDGVRLVGFAHNALAVDPGVLELDEKLKQESLDNQALFGKLSDVEHKKMEEEFIKRAGGILDTSGPKKSKRNEKVPTITQTRLLLDKGLDLWQIADERAMTVETIVSHIEKLVALKENIKIDHIRPKEEEIKLVKKYMAKNDGKLTPIKSALNSAGYNMSFEQIRIARLFCK